MVPTRHRFKRVTSTQCEAERLLSEGAARLGDVVIADEQTAGRGRFGRSWISPTGGLYMTLITRMEPMLSLKAGLAIRGALSGVGVTATLKWPNDILVGDLKIAGVLIETDGTVARVGIGLNLTVSPLATATHVQRYVERVDREDLVEAIARTIQQAIPEASILSDYRAACSTIGARIRIQTPGDETRIEGLAAGINDRGGLLVKTDQQVLTIESGECQHVRPAD